MERRAMEFIFLCDEGVQTSGLVDYVEYAYLSVASKSDRVLRLDRWRLLTRFVLHTKEQDLVFISVTIFPICLELLS